MLEYVSAVGVIAVYLFFNVHIFWSALAVSAVSQCELTQGFAFSQRASAGISGVW